MLKVLGKFEDGDDRRAEHDPRIGG